MKSSLAFPIYIFCLIVLARCRDDITPVFEDTPSEVVVEKGDTAVLHCSVKFLGRHQVVWTDGYSTLIAYNEFMIIHDPRLSIERPSYAPFNLRIRNVSMADAGEYTCQVNTVPVISRTIELDVSGQRIPPTIFESSDDVVVKEGSDVSLICNASGTPLPNITWYRFNGGRTWDERQQLHGSGGVLDIVNISRDEEDLYECVATNDAGTSRHLIKVTVEFPPTLERYAYKITQQIGRTVVVDCIVTSSPEAIVIWRFGNKKLKNEGQYIAEESTVTTSLKIRNLAEPDFGLYTCEAQNIHGKANIIVEVEEAESSGYGDHKDRFTDAPTIETYAVQIFQNIGGTVILEADVISSQEPAVVWKFRNNEVSGNSSKFSRFDNRLINRTYSSLKITNISNNELGLYTCEAKNIDGTSEAVLEVRDTNAPIIYNASDDVTVREGENVTLFCDVSGTPKPLVTWCKVDSTGDVLQRLPDSGSVIRILNISRFDDDIFECEATNDYGTSRRRVKVTVEFPPRIEVTALGVAQNVGGNVMLNCIVTSSPPSLIQWKFDDIDKIYISRKDKIFYGALPYKEWRHYFKANDRVSNKQGFRSLQMRSR